MKERCLRDALTKQAHFEQAGFVPLLKSSPARDTSHEQLPMIIMIDTRPLFPL